MFNTKIFNLRGYFIFPRKGLNNLQASEILNLSLDKNHYLNYVDRGSVKPYEVDKGMKDGLLKKNSEINKKLLQFIESNYGKNFLANIKSKLKLSNHQIRIYHYDFQNKPRRLHFDSIKKSVKLFILLKEIKTLERGPYCVIPYSHFLNKIFYLIKYSLL